MPFRISSFLCPNIYFWLCRPKNGLWLLENSRLTHISNFRKVIKLLSSAKWHRYSVYAGIFYSLSSRLISFSVAVRGDKTVLLDTGLELPQFAANGITRHHFFLTTLDFLAYRAELLTLYQVLKTPLPARFSELGFYRTCKISPLSLFCSNLVQNPVFTNRNSLNIIRVSWQSDQSTAWVVKWERPLIFVQIVHLIK